jgi:hypothetical protein
MAGRERLMPDFDGGHYFYTGFFPLNREPVARPDGSVTVPSHLLREALASLPNFSLDPASRRTSPFARCTSTHLARLFVLDDPTFNGRDPGNAIRQGLKKTDLLLHQPVDHLARPWLVFVADFDATEAGAGPRDRWAAGLWEKMEPELRSVFSHCKGFDNVASGEDFARYLSRGQIETTMSFNDYYVDPLNLPSLSLPKLGLTVAAFPLVLLGLAWWLGASWPIWLAALVVGLGLGLFAAYKLIMAKGGRPFPAAPDSDLPSVLKGLYVQQSFTRFAIANQGASPEALHAAFGAFVEQVRPDDVATPTQRPGVLRS